MMWPLFHLYPHPQLLLPIGHYILAVPLCSSGTHLPQGLCTYSSLCLKCSSPNAHMTYILPRSWLKCHLLHDAFPDHSIYHFNGLPASSPARLRSCPCLFFSPLALNTIQHIVLIYRGCCHDPVHPSSDHSGIETHIFVWGLLRANVTNAVVNCARSLFILMLSTITKSLVVGMTLKLGMLLVSGE